MMKVKIRQEPNIRNRLGTADLITKKPNTVCRKAMKPMKVTIPAAISLSEAHLPVGYFFYLIKRLWLSFSDMIQSSLVGQRQ